MYFNNASWFLSIFYPDLIWKKNDSEKVIYLTFDDGPIPEITEFVLDILKQRSIHATFFCVGDNIRKHPEIFKRIITENHQVGNHTFNHLKGWKTNDDEYLMNIKQCNTIIKEYSGGIETKIFRPPYGLIKKSQIRKIKDNFDIIMWDCLTGDFDPGNSPDDCLKKAIRYTRNGSIVVFHDNIKAKVNLYHSLPFYLDHYIKKGYIFKKL